MLEVCIDNLESAKNAIVGGATRLEVCSRLDQGGLTPLLDLINSIKAISDIPLHGMIRPRPGDFNYDSADIALILAQFTQLLEYDLDGYVFGALDNLGNVNRSLCADIRQLAQGKQLVFHRAIDDTFNYFNAIEEVIRLGYDEILTSGHALNASDGLRNLIEAKRLTKGKISILAGSGINSMNINQFIENGILQIHGSFAIKEESKNVAGTWKTKTQINEVKAIHDALLS